MPLEHAIIEILDRDAIDPSRGLERKFKVQFNPTDFTVNKAAQIAEINIPGIDSPILQFIRGQNEKVTLDLFFDTTEFGMEEGAKDVRDLTKSVLSARKDPAENARGARDSVHLG